MFFEHAMCGRVTREKDGALRSFNKKMSLALYRDLACLLMQVGLRPLRVFEIVFGVVES